MEKVASTARTRHTATVHVCMRQAGATILIGEVASCSPHCPGERCRTEGSCRWLQLSSNLAPVDSSPVCMKKRDREWEREGGRERERERERERWSVSGTSTCYTCASIVMYMWRGGDESNRTCRCARTTRVPSNNNKHVHQPSVAWHSKSVFCNVCG